MPPKRVTSEGNTRLWVLMAGGCVLAALGFSWWGQSPLAKYLVRESVTLQWARHAMFLLDWTLMCIAMMLPTAAPMLRAVYRLGRDRQEAIKLTIACAIAFTLVWASAGVVVRFAHGLAFNFLQSLPQSTERNQLFVSLLLGLGGVYLLLPIAQRCVTACRSPMGFVARHWTGRIDVTWQSARMGLSYGASCFGCCWPLMLAMCMLGWTDPIWMIAGGLAMAFQKLSNWGHWFTRGIGVLAIVMTFGIATQTIGLAYVAPLWSPDGWANCGVF